jgi:hypothetical protein
MSIWKKLFGSSSTPQLKQYRGYLVSIPKEDVAGMSLANLDDYLKIAMDSTVTRQELHSLELTIGGYDGDSRELYEIPEVVAWMRHVQAQRKSITYWLTPGSLFMFILCCLPNSWRRLPDGQLEMTIEPAEVTQMTQGGGIAAMMQLAMSGMPPEKMSAIVNQSAQKLSEGMQGRFHGRDYMVVAT